MFRTARKTVVAAAALGALALGGSAIADAASSSTATTTTAANTQPAPDGMPSGPHVGANGKQEEPLTGTTAAKVRAAALAKVSGGTVERVETDADHGSPFEAHVRKPDGTELEVLVDKDFAVTAVNTMGQR
jgi:uncharacterized membrane protein YkoI